MMLGHMLLMSSGDSETWQVSDKTFSIFITNNPITKQALERIQIERYLSIIQQTQKSLAFNILPISTHPNDSPDFLVERNGQTIGIDVAKFAFTERQRAFAQFRKIKQYLREQYRAGRLRGCLGLNIVLEFSDKFLPLPNRIEPTLVELVEQFEKLTPDWKNINQSSKNARSGLMGYTSMQFPLGEEGITTDGKISWYVSDLCGNAQNSFSSECQFNVEHQYLATATEDEVRKRLDEIVSKHDKPNQKIDELVIIAGGPDNFGEAVLDEGLLAQTYIEKSKIGIAQPKNLKKVSLTIWTKNIVHTLYEL